MDDKSKVGEQTPTETPVKETATQGAETPKTEETVQPAHATKSKSQVKRENEVKKAKEPEVPHVSEEPKEELSEVEEPASEPVEELPETMVTLKSADGRPLEVSIGDANWKGVVIEVPQSQVADVRRILEGAGYFLKD